MSSVFSKVLQRVQVPIAARFGIGTTTNRIYLKKHGPRFYFIF